MRLQLIFCFLLFYSFQVFSVNNNITNIDSLKNTLSSTKSEKQKAALCLQIAKNVKHYDSILLYSERALNMAKLCGDTSMLGDIYKSIGVAYHLASSYKNALTYYDSALFFLNQKNDANTIARTYSNKCGIYIRFNSLDSAIVNNEKCKEYSKFINDPDLDRIYLKRKANILSIQGKYHESIKVLKEIQKQASTTNKSKSFNYKDIASNFYDMGMMDSALYYNKLALQTNAHKYPTDEISTLNNMANVYNFTGDDENSIKCYLRAIHIADSIDYEYGKALIGSNLANLYFNWGKYKEAIKIYKEHIPYLKKNSIWHNLAVNYINIGISYNSIGLIDSSLLYLEKTKDICLATNNLSILSTTYHNMGRGFMSQQNYHKALLYFEKALETNKIDNSSNTKANIYHDMSICYSALKKYPLAISLADSAKSIYLRVKNGKQSIDVQLTLSEIYAQSGNYKEAYTKLNDYRIKNDSLFSKEKYKQISELETQYETAQKEAQIQKQLVKISADKLIINKEKNKALTYAVLFAGAAILLLLILIFLLRNKQKHQLVKKELVQHKMELEGRLLRSQMNPHFIFNSLNSIQSYITSNDQYHAETYLSKFAKLMRSILENSRHAFVSFEQDLSTLMIYTELEHLRFEGQFTYEFTIDDQINFENTYIPPMLVQPYIENAILHGLVAKKDNNGNLEVKFELMDNDFIKCTIKDNGIGREKAREIKKRTVKPYKSLGMQVTKERMELISEINKVSFEEKITDLKNEEYVAIGTLVELIIPFEKD